MFDEGEAGDRRLRQARLPHRRPGTGQLTKMVNQICIVGLAQALAEALAFAKETIWISRR